jgi:hypothetical protein
MGPFTYKTLYGGYLISSLSHHLLNAQDRRFLFMTCQQLQVVLQIERELATSLLQIETCMIILVETSLLPKRQEHHHLYRGYLFSLQLMLYQESSLAKLSRTLKPYLVLIYRNLVTQLHPLLWRSETFELTHQLFISNRTEVAQRRGTRK